MRFHCEKPGRHVTTLRVNHFFTRQNKPIPPRERGRIGSQVTLDKYGHASVLPTRSRGPRPVPTSSLSSRWLSIYTKIDQEIIVVQAVSAQIRLADG